MEGVLKTQTEAHNQKMLELQTTAVENQLRCLSLSPLSPAHANIGAAGVQHPTTDQDQATELIGVSSLADKLSKLRPEYYCDPGKTYEKMTFRELIRGCTKVLSFLCVSNVNASGWVSLSSKFSPV